MDVQIFWTMAYCEADVEHGQEQSDTHQYSQQLYMDPYMGHYSQLKPIYVLNECKAPY